MPDGAILRALEPVDRIDGTLAAGIRHGSPFAYEWLGSLGLDYLSGPELNDQGIVFRAKGENVALLVHGADTDVRDAEVRLDHCGDFWLQGLSIDLTHRFEGPLEFASWVLDTSVLDAAAHAVQACVVFRDYLPGLFWLDHSTASAVGEIEFWQPLDAASVPRTEFLYGKFYARGYTSLTLAAPKVGKSMLALAEAVDMATGRGFLTGKQADPLRVTYYCAEDRLSDIQLRVLALCQMYEIDQAELVGHLAVASGVEHSEFCLIDGTDPKINEAAFDGVEALCAKTAADVLIFDPLQDLSHAPETNEAFRMLGQRMRQLASDCDVALGIIHHTRKPQMGATPSIDDGRGGSALRGTCRFNRLLVGMTQDEAAKADVADHRQYMRIADAESNLAPPSSSVNRWFQKVSVYLDGDDEDGTGAIRPWHWPDAFAGISVEMAREVQARIRDRDEDDLPRANVQAKDWVGHLVGEVCEIDTSEKAGKQRAADIVKAWLKSGVLDQADVHDSRSGRSVSVITVGRTDMNDGGG